MPATRLAGLQLLWLVLLSVLALLPGLGSSRRLTYHEAFVAQGAKEILDSGNWAHPTIGGLPWLEKPPLPWWLVAALGRCVGQVNETVARFPSALAASVLVLGVGVLAARHYGAGVGMLAGAVQATTFWTVMRGRLAEADLLLACLITWTIVAFDRIQSDAQLDADGSSSLATRQGIARWAFFGLLGSTALVKGIGFGAVLILGVIVGMVVWQRDGRTLRRLWFPAGWVLTAAIALTWPLFMVMRYGLRVLVLWMMHVTDRLVGHPGPGLFAGEPKWEYVSGLLAQALPWAPLALIGAWPSLRRALLRGGNAVDRSARAGIPAAVLAGDRLLWAWTIAPLSLLAMATVRNAHYAISAQVPWSIWSALALARLGARLRYRGWDRRALLVAAQAGFTTLAMAYGLGLWVLGPWFDRRGIEWAFYETAGRRVSPDIPLALLYDDWDRNPYESPFGPIPHDLAVRLFYLGRPACWCIGANTLSAHDHTTVGCSPGSSPSVADIFSPHPLASVFAVIGRELDRPALDRIGQVELVARGPSVRSDRTYALFQVTRDHGNVRSAGALRTRATY
jgi:4-amino-4-deoxy-L-arabinose transferase-like glycosyltransferase